MQRKQLYILLTSAGILMVGVFAIALALPQSAKAQCGSQASSCKNCHEVQGQDSVNADGTGWHQSHAFGDFCYICHGGNNQATDKDAAHTGMVDPLADIQASCTQCHPDDLQAKAQVYASALGVTLKSGPSAPSPAATPNAPAPTQAAAEQAPAASLGSLPAGETASLVDYVQRYDENALGRYPTNWGNVILWIMIVAMVIGGGALVAIRERLIRVSFRETKPVAGEYPADVVDMVPDLVKLKPGARKTLQKMLRQDPTAAANLLDAVDQFTQDKKEQ